MATVTYVYVMILCISPVAFSVVSCLQVIPQRANITYLNKKYAEYGIISVVRYGRKSPYYINVEGITKQTWNNNVTVNFIFYEYLHNEYKRTFVEFHYKFCDMINKDPYVGGLLISAGVVCPAPAGKYKLMNLTVPAENFPNVWPFEKARVDGDITVTETKESMAKLELFVIFKKSNKRKN